MDVVQAEIGLIGLGVMGANLALNIAEKGFTVAVYNRTAARTDDFFAAAGSLAPNIVPCHTIEEFVGAVRPPRPIIVMVTAGAAVDEQIAGLRPLLAADDMIIDAGNANFHDTERRTAELAKTGPRFIGMGVSGGEEGARHGPSIMVGGPREAYERVAPVLTAIAARFEGQPCCAWLGPGGAGHFVKTIHNGIEYADMQMIAEIYGIMRDGLKMSAADMAAIFTDWNKGKLNSYLIEITGAVLATADPSTRRPLVDVILDRAAQKGTGKWAVIEAQTLGVPATAIEAAVAARVLSSMKDERVKAEAAYAIAPAELPRDATVRDPHLLEAALYAGKIAAYAQGFAVMERASADRGWNLPLATVAAIWRAGCIIRSQFLGQITAAFGASGGSGNLLMAPDFMAAMRAGHTALRATIADAARTGLPVPALSAALAYFDGYRQARGNANLIQGQRDFFGAHSFERIGEEGAYHGPWHRA
jgi:6-phosphogluconate dehydrogenase